VLSEVGVLYLALSITLFVLSYLRARHSRHDFADRSSKKLDALYQQAIPTVGQENKREFGRPFVTAGLDVALIGVVVFGVEVAILVLIFEL